MEEEEAFSIKNCESDGCWYKMIICDMKKCDAQHHSTL